MRILRYFSYVIRHKWFVLIECWRRGLIWRGLVHDWHKLLPDEFFAYVSQFGGGIQTGRDKTGYYKPEDTGNPAFEEAWHRHWHRADHHWQFWVQFKHGYGSGGPRWELEALKMSRDAWQEMLCDWIGAGRAQGKPDTQHWFATHKGDMKLHPHTLAEICQVLHVRMWP